MKILVYSSRPYDREFLEAVNHGKHEFHFTETRREEAAILSEALNEIE